MNNNTSLTAIKHAIAGMALSVALIGVCSAEDDVESALGESTSRVSDQWELKGLHVGDSFDHAMSLFPGLECTSAAPTVKRCLAQNETYAGKPAELKVFFVDDEAVSIQFLRLEPDVVERVATIFAEKYGAPSNRVNVSKFDTAKGVYRKAVETTWSTDGRLMILSPLKVSDPKKREIYGLVGLIDIELGNREYDRRVKLAKEGRSEVRVSRDDL